MNQPASKSLLLLIPALFLSSSASAQISNKYLDPQMRSPVVAQSRFAQQDIFNRNFVELKAAEWKACHQPEPTPFRSSARESLASFVDSQEVLKSLQEMDNRKLKEGKVTKQPWSGDYWAYDSGLLGFRAFDPEFQDLWDWKSRYDYIQDHPLQSYLTEDSAEKLQQLSPSEKYDLILGSHTGELTKSMWAQGKLYFDEYGKVEGWMGICHGWAPAAIVEPRPEKTVFIQSAVGPTKIEPIPSEIKGLTSYSWATNPYRTVTLGKRCNEKDPKRDENGRILNPDCLDLNPATWHLAVVNRVGLHKKSFVMDATYDYQVWNQPVLEYKVQYVQPVSGQVQDQLSNAVVAIDDWESDPYKKYRSSEAKSVVGIRMKLAYVVESGVSDLAEDDASQDIIYWVSYDYDLELDKKGNIIGGEWYQDDHPDFIWTPRAGALPNSAYDSLLKEEWDVAQSVPNRWKQVAEVASPQGIILNHVVQSILSRSRSDQ